MALIDISKINRAKPVVTSVYKDTSLRHPQYAYNEFCQELVKLSAKALSEYQVRFLRVMYEDALKGQDSELFRFAYNAVKGKKNIAPFDDKRKLAVHIIAMAMPLFHADNFIRVNYMDDSATENCVRATSITLKKKSEGLPITMKSVLSKFVIPYMREFVLPRIELGDDDKRLFDSERWGVKAGDGNRKDAFAHGVSVTMLPISSPSDSPKVNTYYLPTEKNGNIYVNDVNHSYVGNASDILSDFYKPKQGYLGSSTRLRVVDLNIYDRIDSDSHNVVHNVIKDISKALSRQGIIPDEEQSEANLIDAFIGVDTRSLPSSKMLLHRDDVSIRAVLEKYELKQIASWYDRIIGFQQLNTIKEVKLSSSHKEGDIDISSTILYAYTDYYESPIGTTFEDADVDYVFKHRVLSLLESNTIGGRIYNSITEEVLRLLESYIRTASTPWLKIIDNIYGVNYQELDRYSNFIGFRTPQIYSYVKTNLTGRPIEFRDTIELTYVDKIEAKFHF